MMQLFKIIALLGALSAWVACDTADTAATDATPSVSAEDDISAERARAEDTSEASVDEDDTMGANEPSTGSDASAPERGAAEADIATGPEATTVAETMMTVQLINAGTNGPYAGVTVSTGGVQETTDPSGQASVPVPVGPYHVVLSAADARAHHLYGVADADAFTQISFMSPESITMGVFGSLAIQDDPSRGTLVVGLDRPNLAAAVGASAAIDASSDPAFIFSGFFPTTGSTIVAGGQSFVTFPNVEAGPVQVSATMPDGACLPFPALTGELAVEVHPGEVSVVAFICE